MAEDISTKCKPSWVYISDLFLRYSIKKGICLSRVYLNHFKVLMPVQKNQHIDKVGGTIPSLWVFPVHFKSVDMNSFKTWASGSFLEKSPN